MPLDVVADHVHAQYGVRGTVSTLPGEHDDNFLVESADGPLVLRVVAEDQGEDRDRFILALLSSLEGMDTLCPVLVPTVGGSVDPLIRDGGGHARRSWLTSFVHGTPWVERLEDPGTARAVGLGLAVLDRCLEEVSTSPASGRTPWDLTNPQGALDLIHGVPLGRDDRRIRACLHELEESVLPGLRHARRQPIHNDANPDNVLLQLDGGVGFIDFGDAVWAPRVVELAVAGSYLADIGTASSPQSPLTALIHGYGSLLPLTPVDLRSLPGLMRGRLALALGNALARAHHRPERADYVLRHADRARRRMDALDSLDVDDALRSWASAAEER
jgi:hydroxylysine kinase